MTRLVELDLKLKDKTITDDELEVLDDLAEAEFDKQQHDLEVIYSFIETASSTLEENNIGRQATWTEHEQMSISVAKMMHDAYLRRQND